LGCGEIKREMILFGHSADVAIFTRANEWSEILRLNVEPLLLEHGNRRFVDERFGVGEHAIHIKDHGTNRWWFLHSPFRQSGSLRPKQLARREQEIHTLLGREPRPISSKTGNRDLLGKLCRKCDKVL